MADVNITPVSPSFTTGFTTGSVIFSSGTALTEDNSNFFWNNTTKQLSIKGISTTGSVSITGSVLLSNGAAVTPSLGFASETGLGIYRPSTSVIDLVRGGNPYIRFDTAGVLLSTIFPIGMGPTIGSPDVILSRDAANVLALKNGANAQTLRIYGNASASTAITNDGVSGYIFASASGDLFLGANAASKWRISSAGHFLAFSDNATDIGGGGARPRDYYGAGAITSAGATSGIGYTTGAGGTVTQITNKATTVVLNKVCGTITLNNASLAADTTVSFTFTNSAIAATDCLYIQHDSVGTLGAYTFATTPAAGSATISVHNCTPGALGEAIVLRFAVIKAVVA